MTINPLDIGRDALAQALVEAVTFARCFGCGDALGANLIEDAVGNRYCHPDCRDLFTVKCVVHEDWYPRDGAVKDENGNLYCDAECKRASDEQHAGHEEAREEGWGKR